MKAKIFKTERQALSSAKDTAIEAYQFLTGKNYAPSTASRIKYTPENWVIRHTSTNCVCGETGAVRAFLMAKNQTEGMAGYCEYCGSKNPMN